MKEIKNIIPSGKDESVEPEAQDAGFHFFPGNKAGFKFPSFGGKRLKTVGIICGILTLLLVVFVAVPAFAVYQSGKQLALSVQKLENTVKTQNLDDIGKGLNGLKVDLQAFDGSLGRLVWIKFIPFVGNYWKDADAASKGGIYGIEAGEVVLKTVEPYADILGFNGGKQAQDGQKTAEDRINFIVETIGSITPQLDQINAKTKLMTEEFNKIDINRYPENFQGRKIREPMRKGLALINQVGQFVAGGKPVLEQAPYLLGVNGERTYLFLWQNDKELRPTGGFITAYSIVKVKNGKFAPVASSDIYNLDSKLQSKMAAPEPIKKYLPNVPYWNLRDMNLSPDVKVSMDTFKENYNKTKSPAIDGIVIMDTKLLVDVLKVIGRIGVPGYGNYSAEDDSRCSCPVVIYELESFADVAGPIVWDDISGKIVYKPPHANNRKEVLGPLMNSLLANAMGQPKEKIPGLFEAGFNSLLEKHVMFYFGDSDVQKAMESFNLAGRIVDYGGDYLHINDTNFAGAKSNLYVQEEVNLKVEPGRDGGTNVLTIKYKNPQRHDGWLNGVYRDWIRVYVPKGSQLVDSTGSEVPVTTSEDLGKTVFEGFFTLRPEGVAQLTFKYKTPVKQNGGYKLMIQKQPGTDGNLYNVQVGRNSEEFYLKTDKEFHF